MKVVAGDIGGTKTLLQVAEISGHTCEVAFEHRYDSHAYPHFLPLLREFLDAAQARTGARPASVGLGVAGPVHEGRVHTTNLPWMLDARELERELGLERVRLVNDFQAIGYGIELLGPGDLVTLQAGHGQPHGVRAILGAGTGLGEGAAVWTGDRWEMLASEGGHADFAPVDEEQEALLAHLRAKLGRVSWERVLSGSGLVRVYEFLRDSGRGEESAALREAMQSGDAAAAVSGFALEGRDPLAGHALDLFVGIYGAQAGNLALTFLATGGVYVGGGIAPKIVARLRDGGFMRAFRAKEPMQSVVAEIPVHVITNTRVGLLGPALLASRG